MVRVTKKAPTPKKVKSKPKSVKAALRSAALAEAAAESEEELVYLSDVGASDDEGHPTRPAPSPRNKSGRWWKPQRLERKLGMVKDSKVHSGWAEKLRRKADDKSVRELRDQLIDDRGAKLAAKRERRKENLKRKEENQRKAEVVQKVKSVHKLKRMKRKLLRTIEKRDTGTEGVAGPGFDD